MATKLGAIMAVKSKYHFPGVSMFMVTRFVKICLVMVLFVASSSCYASKIFRWLKWVFHERVIVSNHRRFKKWRERHPSYCTISYTPSSRFSVIGLKHLKKRKVTAVNTFCTSPVRMPKQLHTNDIKPILSVTAPPSKILR